jgi:hypothetical protein
VVIRSVVLFFVSLLLLAWLPRATPAGSILTQGALNAELGTSCAAQGKPAPCITPAQMSDLVTTAVPLVSSGISAAGNSQGTATALTGQMNTVATVAAGAGVVLPSPVAGQEVFVSNQGANPLTVYPPTGAAIDVLAANAPVTVAVGATAELIAVSATAINTVP